MSDNENNNTPQNENIEQEEINTLTVITKSCYSIIKLNHNQIKIELEKRKLNTEGKITELKSRLFRYLKGEWLDTDFSKNNKIMSDKTPFYKPTKFSGAIHENIDSFIQKYNKASNINAWSVEQKKSFLPIYLVNTASTFLDNFENNYPTSNWDQVERALRLEFEPTAQKHMLRTMLEKRKQLPEETTASYINDAENLCKRIDPNMSQSEIAHTIMKGLKPEIARYVGILDNTNLEDLKKNIRKYESIEFMINGKTTQSNDDIRTQITKEHVNIIEENKTKKQIDTLTNQISNLETTINNLNQQIINNNKNFGKSNNNQYTNRPEINRQYTNRLHQGQVNSNKNNYIQNSNYEKTRQPSQL
ncbi:unnamed protein product [Macrosiphum euphorbiae]|uniref:Retrotransposon gag domain-containing protein n=1 Tax=Macrosiphum euphorbiae TaxID=13131 RepID=A0AAV0XP23_9HEMI|nr:unnamed protein product [Macrosiphum euphorbiae]